ncbi:MAG: chromate transporter [Gaiellales bacterium]|nr:chromate transporter [Gaiellales bacterium]
MPPVTLATVVREWGRIGCIGFGGPPTHIALLRQLCVDRHGWLDPAEFEDAVASCNLLPGPASTQLSILCAWRVRGTGGALVGGLCFIVPGLVLILALAALFLEGSPPAWIAGAGAGAGAAVAAVAVHAAAGLVPASFGRAPRRLRWLGYVVAGAFASAFLGPFVVLVLIACGLAELLRRRLAPGMPSTSLSVLPFTTFVSAAPALAWVAFKVGALSYGGGFVIVPLMQADAVSVHHWMTAGQFLNAVALGQVTPGPVVHTVAVVGYAAGGLAGGVLAAVVAFTPSFAFILVGARHLERLRRSARVRAFLDGAGPAAIGSILGASVPLARALQHGWQVGVLAAALASLLVLRRGVLLTLLAAAAAGAALALLGAGTG